VREAYEANGAVHLPGFSFRSRILRTAFRFVRILKQEDVATDIASIPIRLVTTEIF